MAFYFQLNSWKQGTSERGPVNWPIYQFLDGWWTTPCRTRKCIPRGYTAKGNCFLGRTKLSLGQLFPFLDHQLCLALLRSADNLLMIAESEKLSLGKFCSSSKTFLSSIPCRNIYSQCVCCSSKQRQMHCNQKKPLTKQIKYPNKVRKFLSI